jgi:SAM-dependent methyltransferase
MTAPREVVPVVLKFVRPDTVLDIGCGIGTWLKAFEEHGIIEYIGVDGNYIDRTMLQIPLTKFRSHDLTLPLDLEKKFDLVVSIEVAEHLHPEAADVFVESLVKHGDTILFSAAIPGQGGQHHLNEQWPQYWQAKFEKHGYYFHDLIRPLIWNNDKVDFWYRQNLFLLKQEQPSASLKALVHPRLHELRLKNEAEYQQSLLKGKQGMRVSFTIFWNAIKYKVRNLLGI